MRPAGVGSGMRAAVWRVPSRGRTDPSGEDAIPEKHQGHSDKLTCRVWPWRFSSRSASIQSLGERPSITWDFHPNRDQTCSRLRLIHCTLPFGRCSLTPELSRTAARHGGVVHVTALSRAAKRSRLERIVRPRALSSEPETREACLSTTLGGPRGGGA